MMVLLDTAKTLPAFPGLTQLPTTEMMQSHGIAWHIAWLP